MLNKFLIANLDGQRVLSGGGAFTPAQFEAHEVVFHPGFAFGIDPLRPLSAGSYELSSEGVPAAAIDYVAGGRLMTPLLDLKHAKKAGRPPTPMPRGSSSFALPAPASDVEALVAGLDRGLIVHQMLGLHTQDSARGSFSLTVAQGLVVEDGRAIGRAKALIAGNFLEALREGPTFASVPGKDGLALMIMGEVLPG
jgi:PmbA protein